MTCADCERESSRALQREPGVRQARVSYANARAWVVVDRQVPTAQRTLPADTFANMVVFAMSQPDDVDFNESLFRLVSQEL